MLNFLQLENTHVCLRAVANEKKDRPGNWKRKKCPYCAKKFKNVNFHVSVKHGERWSEYLRTLGPYDLTHNTLNRCSTCGVLVKDLIRHINKVHLYY